MRISLPFLRDKDLRTSLLIMITRSCQPPPPVLPPLRDGGRGSRLTTSTVGTTPPRGGRGSAAVRRAPTKTPTWMRRERQERGETWARKKN